MIITIITLLILSQLLINWIDKNINKYKIRMWFWTVIFLYQVFCIKAKSNIYINLHPTLLTILFWLFLINGFWYLTKACFFIEINESNQQIKRK